MGIPAVIVESGGIPVTISDNASSFEIADNGFGIGITIVESGGLPVSGIESESPGEPVSLFAADPALASDDSNPDCFFRIACTLAEDMQDQFRVTIQPGSGNLTSPHVGVGIWTGDPDAPDSTIPFVEVQFEGAYGFANKATAQTSDWMDVGELAGLLAGDKVLVSYSTGISGQSSQKYSGSSTNATGFFKTASDEWDDRTPTGITKLSGLNFCVASIETRTAPPPSAENTIPMSFDDPMFARMSELTSPITLGDGRDAIRKSIIEATGDPSIVCNVGSGGNIVRYCRVNSREAVRLLNKAVIDKCYLEATGLAGVDHADTVQVFSEATRGGDISVTNTHIVAHNDDATAGFFCADDWGGAIAFEDVIFQGGPYGLRINADPTCHIDISLKNVYFVGQFGTGPFLFQDVSDGTHTILQWDNVREATIVNGVLVPGNLIANPG